VLPEITYPDLCFLITIYRCTLTMSLWVSSSIGQLFKNSHEHTCKVICPCHYLQYFKVAFIHPDIAIYVSPPKLVISVSLCSQGREKDTS